MGSIGILEHLDVLPSGHSFKAQKQLTQTLRALLSPAAKVYERGDDEFAELTLRWQKYKSPDFQISVVVACEDDIMKTVQVANRHNVPFLTCVSGHGAIDLSGLRNGIQIQMRQLNSISVDSARNVATIGGGCLIHEVTEELWKRDKHTTTGMGEAVGMSGLALGGGHGLLQGMYGLATDQLISVRLILWDGSVVIASEASNPDLFWALRGAGHNFGIVTELQYRIYDVLPEKRKWVSETLMFKQDRLEEVFEASSTLISTQPADFVHFLFMKWQPEIDPTNPIIKFLVMYNNDLPNCRKYTNQFRKFDPIVDTAVVIDYPEHSGVMESRKGDMMSLKLGATHSIMRFPTGVKAYNVPAARIAFDKYSQFTKANPEFAMSFIMTEGYSAHAVKAVPKDSTAIAYRDESIFFSPGIIFADNDDVEVQQKAITFGQDLRDSFNQGTELSAYVNYAMGDEGLKAWYGHESWRLEKLKSLKRKWDPHQKFSFYAGIPVQ